VSVDFSKLTTSVSYLKASLCFFCSWRRDIYLVADNNFSTYVTVYSILLVQWLL